MPIAQDLSTTVLVPINDGTFDVHTGREIFDELSYTGLNRIPVQKLMSGTLAHVTVNGSPPFDVKDITERLLVDGSIALARGVPLENLEYVSETVVVQYVSGSRRKTEDGKWMVDIENPTIVRVAELKGDTWTRRTIKHPGAKADKNEGIEEEVIKTETFPAGELLPFPNGRGVLYHAQRQYRRLETIAKTLEANTAKDRLKAFILGYSGGEQKIRDLIKQGEEFINLAGATDIKQVVSTELSQRLMEEFTLLLPQYLEATYVVRLAESAASGVSKAYDLLPYTNKVKETQGQITEMVQLYDGVAANAVVFDNPPTATVQDRAAEYALLQEMLQAGDITADEKKEKARRLI